MTQLQKLELRRSKIRSRLAELADIEELQEEDQSEIRSLKTEYATLEERYQAAIIASPDEKPTPIEEADRQQKETLELRSKAKLGRYVQSLVGGKVLDGVESEYSDAVDTPAAQEGGVVVPLSLFGDDIETRAVSPAPADTDVSRTLQPVIPRVFQRSVAPFLMVSMPSMGVGLYAYVSLTTGLSTAFKAEDAAADEGAAAFTVATLDGRRLTGSFRIRVEDVAKLVDLEESLRNDLTESISNSLNDQILNGDGSAPNLNGFLNQLTDASDPDAANTFGTFHSRVYGHVDGLYATQLQDLRLLVGTQTYVGMASTFATESNAVSVLRSLMDSGVQIMSTGRIAAPASNIQQAVVARTYGGPYACCPVWRGVEIIRDPYSAAASGQVVITALSLVGGVGLERAAAYAQTSFHLA